MAICTCTIEATRGPPRHTRPTPLQLMWPHPARVDHWTIRPCDAVTTIARHQPLGIRSTNITHATTKNPRNQTAAARSRMHNA
jgi:hypothetical protein